MYMATKMMRLLSTPTAKHMKTLYFSSTHNTTTAFADAASVFPPSPPYSTSPSIASSAPSSASPKEGEEAASTDTEKEAEHITTRKKPKAQPASSSPKLENTSVNNPAQPITQQKRHLSNPIDGVSCVGLDGSPWPDQKNEGDFKQQRKEQEEDDKEYFSQHKASPLSEIEVADSRKPVTQATDGTAGGSMVGGGDGLILFKEEQLDTAEEALMRAMEMWRESAVRGDPQSPHGRILRDLRGEYW